MIFISVYNHYSIIIIKILQFLLKRISKIKISSHNLKKDSQNERMNETYYNFMYKILYERILCR